MFVVEYTLKSGKINRDEFADYNESLVHFGGMRKSGLTATIRLFALVGETELPMLSQ